MVAVGKESEEYQNSPDDPMLVGQRHIKIYVVLFVRLLLLGSQETWNFSTNRQWF